MKTRSPYLINLLHTEDLKMMGPVSLFYIKNSKLAILLYINLFDSDLPGKND